MTTVSALGALAALIVAIFLILKKVSPAYGMLVGALVGGLIGGADLSQTVSLMIGGAQGITTAVMRILAAGVLAGVLIESGAANTIAETIVRILGETRALLALILATMILTAVGVFVDVSVITVSPIALALARRTDLSKPAILLAMVGGGKAGNLMSPNPNAIAAADTFRAAAGDQLQEWANRAGVDMIGGQEGADPAAIVYDAVAAAKARNADVLLCDTAGRLHNKKNLMEELKKINRILEKEYADAYRETLVVLDATTGQNALNQAREFSECADITGIILTKMDGTAKGGIAVAIHSELGIPVKYIGVGETIEDLQKFDSNQFVNALFEVGEEKSGC